MRSAFDATDFGALTVFLRVVIFWRAGGGRREPVHQDRRFREASSDFFARILPHCRCPVSCRPYHHDDLCSDPPYELFAAMGPAHVRTIHQDPRRYPLAECERRDVKGLDAAARRRDIRGFMGIDDPYEPPSAPDLRIDTAT